ncbi:hypothetical protein P7C70_g8815, partial [Phenoliferia sp. Uapishka_3]
MASTRPRRSTAGRQSYVHLLKAVSDFDSSSSDSSSNEGSADADSNAGGPSSKASPSKSSKASPTKAKGKAKEKPKKKKKAKKAKDSDDSSDGSVFELDEEEKKQASSDDEELEPTDDEADEGAAPSGRGGGGGGGVTDDSDSDAYSGGRGGGGGKGGGSKQRAGGRGTPNLAVRKLEHQIISAGANTVLKGPSKKPRARVLPTETMGWGAKALAHLFDLGPTYEPPSRYLKIEEGVSLGESMVVMGPATDYNLRAKLSLAWTHLPFGPEGSLCQDLGWWKGKWRDGQEDVKERWGGWYDGVEGAIGEIVENDELPQYLPQLVYPSVPRKIQTEDAYSIDEDASAAGDSILALGEDFTEMPTTIKLRIGPLDADSPEQPLVQIERFVSHRLGESSE